MNVEKQKPNTTSSTEGKVVGDNDSMGLILWMKLFMDERGYLRGKSLTCKLGLLPVRKVSIVIDNIVILITGIIFILAIVGFIIIISFISYIIV